MVMITWGTSHNLKQIISEWKGYDVVKCIKVFWFMGIPYWFTRRIMLHDEKNYYEFDSEKLERRLLKEGDGEYDKYVEILKKHEKKEIHKIKEQVKNKDKIEKKDDEDFMQFLRRIGIGLGILILFLIIWKIFS